MAKDPDFAEALKAELVNQAETLAACGMTLDELREFFEPIIENAVRKHFDDDDPRRGRSPSPAPSPPPAERDAVGGGPLHGDNR